MRRIGSVALAVALVLLLPAAASARPGHVTYLWSDGGVNGDNHLELGWTTDHGTTKHVLVDNNPLTRPTKGRIVLTTSEASNFLVYFEDVSCSKTYFADGTSSGVTVDHASNTAPVTVAKGSAVTHYFRDSGGAPTCWAQNLTQEGSSTVWNGRITLIRPAP